MITKRLQRRINYRMLVKVLGWLVTIESCFMILPMIVSLWYRESDWKPFCFTAILTLVTGILMNKCSRPTDKALSKREGFLLTASVWIIFSLFGMLPLIFCSTPYTVSEAFTEAMSGLTTTGATIIEDVERLSHGVKFWRSLLQWIGGMGIILFTLAVIPMLNHSGGMQMFNAEVTGITHGKLRPRISQTAKSLWTIYIVLTTMCIGLLYIGDMNLFESCTHALSTIATGGFSAYNDGINHYDSMYIKVVTTVFMLLGSVNFALIFTMSTGRFRPVIHDEQLRYMLRFMVVFAIVIFVSRILNHQTSSPGHMIVDTLFMVVSSMSSTSFTIDGFEKWGGLALAAVFILMYTGGCAGSTSGGVKIDRIIVMIKYVRNEVHRALQPNSISAVKVGTRTLKFELVDKVIAFLILDVMIIIFCSMVLSMMGVDLIDGFFSSLSSISNSGMSCPIGETNGTVAQIPAAGKILLSMVMLTGRLEIYTILVLFTGNFWHK